MSCETRSKIKPLLWIILIPLFAFAALAGTVPKGVVPAPPDAGISVGIATDKRVYAPGDEIQIEITVGQECYLYLYDIDPAGTVTLLYPNRFQPNPKVAAGKVILPGKGYKLVVGEPEGTETLVAIASSSPVSTFVPDTKEPFKEYKITPEKFAAELQSALGNSGWSSAWTQITVYQPRSTVLIDSEPEGAEIYVNGDYIGKTPKAITIPATTVRITLKKEGFVPYSQTVELKDKTMAEISARLEQAPVTPPEEEPPHSVTGFFAVDFGRDSVGTELGFEPGIGIGISARFLADETVEVGASIRLHLEIVDNWRVLLGVGLGLQEKPVDSSGVPAPLAIHIEPDTETEVYPDITIGAELDLEYGIIFGGYSLRRGAIVGIGFSFGK